ncbi:MAG: hypothetical protein ACI9QD_000501 [Thermoproteota archaeon]|jgi:hypothetical protein
MGKKSKPIRELTTELKYKYYESSVQNTEFEVETIQKIFKENCNRTAHVLREDFCGTGLLACHWVQQGEDFKAFGIDLDPEPIVYGKENHLVKLSDEEQSRVEYIEGNVLAKYERKADMVVAFNFSYFIFKKRKELVNYFSAVRKNIKKDGLFLLDLFGGPECQTLVEEETEHDDFSYFWDCKKFNPITNECLYAIHFKPKGSKKLRDAFVYDWRMWSLAELRDILLDAGFSDTVAYWEGDDEEDGSGNGEFIATEEAENCESWVTYIAAKP